MSRSFSRTNVTEVPTKAARSCQSKMRSSNQRSQAACCMVQEDGGWITGGGARVSKGGDGVASGAAAKFRRIHSFRIILNILNIFLRNLIKDKN